MRFILESFEVNVNFRTFSGDRETALMCAMSLDSYEILDLLLLHKESDLDYNYNYLMRAVFNDPKAGSGQIVRRLLEVSKMQMNMQDGNEDTALMNAAHLECTKSVRCLLERTDTDVNQRNKDGDTALNLAAFSSHVSIVKLLLTNTGINVNLQKR